jgi:hypothetical protein
MEKREEEEEGEKQYLVGLPENSDETVDVNADLLLRVALLTHKI